MLVRVQAPHFVAGFITDGTVREAAPILRWLVGREDEQARVAIRRKRWSAAVIDRW